MKDLAQKPKKSTCFSDKFSKICKTLIMISIVQKIISHYHKLHDSTINRLFCDYCSRDLGSKPCIKNLSNRFHCIIELIAPL